MTNVNEKRIAILKQLPNLYPYEIKEFINKVNSYEWLDLAIEHNIFDIDIWKSKESLDGYLIFISIINKLGSKCLKKESLNQLIDYFLSFNDDFYYKTILQLVPYLVENGYTQKLLEKLNELLLLNYGNEKVIQIKAIFIDLLRNKKIESDDMPYVSAFFSNLLLLKIDINNLKYLNKDYLDILNYSIQFLLSNLKRNDFLEHNDFIFEDKKIVAGNQKYELNENEYGLLDFDITTQYELSTNFLFFSVDSWLKHSLYDRRFYIRWKIAKLMDELFKNKRTDLDLIKILINSDNIVYKKIGFSLLYNYFTIEDMSEIVNHILSFDFLLNDVTLSKIVCLVIDKSIKLLSSSTMEKIKSVLMLINEGDSGENITLIRAYNFLQNHFNDFNISVPIELSEVTIIDAIESNEAGWVSSHSFLDETEIINDLNGSILRLNSIYMSDKKEEVETFKEKNYHGTLAVLEKVVEHNSFSVDLDTLILLDDYVLGDLLKYINKNENEEMVILAIIERLGRYQKSRLEEENFVLFNKQINLARALNHYIIDNSLQSKISWDIIKKLLLINDSIPPIQFENHNFSSGDHRYVDLFTIYINTVTYEIYDILFTVVNNDREKVLEIVEKIKSEKSILNALALGVYYDYITRLEIEFDINSYLSDYYLKEAFFSTFVYHCRLNKLSCEKVEPIISCYIFEKDLITNNTSLYNNLGKMLYIGYIKSNFFDDLVDNLISKYQSNKKYNTLIFKMLKSSVKSIVSDKDYGLLSKLIDRATLQIFDPSVINGIYYLLSKFDVTEKNISYAEQLLDINDSKNINEGLFVYYKHLVKNEILNHLSERVRKLKARIFEHYKILDELFYLYQIEKINEK